MTSPRRFAFQERDPAHPSGSLLPYLPLVLNNGANQATTLGLLDTGATVNVLPYEVGLSLGLMWSNQTTAIQLTGNLAQAEARAVIVAATIAPFAPTRLAFAWTQIAQIPLILGQVNFFLEFDVCFFRSQAVFEVSLKRTS